MCARASRVDIRITKSVKNTIENAADFLGLTTSAFILECAVARATQILQQAQMITLNVRESRRFLEILENPPAPNKKLKRLLARHKNRKFES